MFIIKRTYHFEAGHNLPLVKGKCQTPHGHSFLLKVSLKSPTLKTKGTEKNMITPFEKIDALVMPMMQKWFDHKWLNESLKTDAPTCEFMAKWIYDHLKPNLPALYSIEVSENALCTAIYMLRLAENGSLG